MQTQTPQYTITAGDLQSIGGDVNFATNGALLRIIIGHYPNDWPKILSVKAAYKKSLFGKVGDVIRVHFEKHESQVEAHLQNSDGSTTFLLVSCAITGGQSPVIQPNNTFRSPASHPINDPLPDTIACITLDRDTQFAISKITNFLSDLQSGNYWLWTRKAEYAWNRDHLEDTDSAQAFFWTETGGKCNFWVRFILKNQNGTIICHGRFNIAVTKINPESGQSRPLRISGVPSLVNFLAMN